MPDASGAFSGILAVLLAGLGQFDEAGQCLRRGEPALRGFNQFGLGAFLARAAQVHGLAGDQERAASAYSEAQQIAEELAVLPGSEIDIELKAAQHIIDGLQEMS